jgi:phosphoglycolate phosphatase-like HAD superfamily hydrolase
MRTAGVDDALITERMDAVLGAYVTRLEADFERDPGVARLCEGVLPLLDALEQQERVTLGLLTGNIEYGARRKLRAVGVAFDRFVVNAFGSDHEERPQLPLVAQQRASAFFGVPMSGDRMVIIGDTPADIHCGRSIGVRAIGVATGRYSVEDLAAHAPADVFASFADTDAVVQSILA